MVAYIGAIQAGGVGPGGPTAQSPPGPGPGPAAPGLPDPQSGPAISSVGRSFLALSAGKDRNASIAGTFRTTEAALAQVARTLSDIRAAYTGIVKHYPPYPVGSPQRDAYLNNIGDFRRQLAAILVPGVVVPTLQPAGQPVAVINGFTGADLQVPAAVPDAPDEALAATLARVVQIEDTVRQAAAQVRRTRENLGATLGPQDEQAASDISAATRGQLANDTEFSLTSGIRTLPDATA